MDCWYFTAIIFVIAPVSGQRFSFIQKDLSELAECIEEEYLNIDNHPHRNDQIDIYGTLSRFIANRFYNTGTKSEEEITNEVHESINELKNRNYISPVDPRWELLEHHSLDALLGDCHDREEVIPEDVDEDPSVGAILMFILEKWEIEPYIMVRTRDGRAELRSDFNYILPFLESCLSRFDHEYFRLLIRIYWMRRAEMGYDGRYFNSDDAYPVESQESWAVRNPPAENFYRQRLFNIHILTQPDDDEYDIYNWYERNGMSSAHYFIESRIDRFYQIIFYFLELRANGITADEDEIFGDTLPEQVLPRSVSTMIGTDDGYRNYLLFRRHDFLTRFNGTDNAIVRNLERCGRVREENLVWLMMNDPSTSGVSTPTIMSTTIESIKTTSSAKPDVFPNKRKKDDVVRSEKTGKNFKRRRATFLESCCNLQHVRSGVIEAYQPTELCLMRRYNYFVTSSKDLVFIVCSMLRAKKQKIIKTPAKHHLYELDYNQFIIPPHETIILLQSLGDTFDLVKKRMNTYKAIHNG